MEAKAGHLFIVRGDLLQLQCDAIALGGDAGSIGRRWINEDPQAPRVPCDLLSVTRAEKDRRLAAGSRCEQMGASWREIDMWRLDIGGGPYKAPEWYVEAAAAFVRDAGATAAKKMQGRRPVVGLPLIGTGRGGATKYEIVPALVKGLIQVAQKEGVDVVMVAASDADYAALQFVRRQVTDAWSGLDNDLCTAAEEVAAQFRGGQPPVVFVGAGVSRGAGLPGWIDLLVELHNNDAEGAQLREYAQADPLGAAEIVVRSRFDALAPDQGEQALAKLVRGRLEQSPRMTLPSLGHTLLASLPSRHFVTTNYDCLLESALKAIDPWVQILPGPQARRSDRWVLKLHGSIDTAETLVLTRRSYLRYDTQWRGLLSIVEATILLQHMLIVGFSLSDPNFYRVVDSARRVSEGQGQHGSAAPFGTTLVVGAPDQFRDRLWPDLRIIDFGDVGQGARRQLIFLDRVGAAATASRHLLSDDFTPLLDARYRQIARHLGDAATVLGTGDDLPELRLLLKQYGKPPSLS